MEPADATGGNRRQTGCARNRSNRPDPQAVATHGNRFAAHGKKEVDGSSPSEGFSVLPAQSSLAFSGVTPTGCFGIHRPSTSVHGVELGCVQRVEELDRVLAFVAGEVAVGAVDHGQTGAHVAREVEG
jgi:hypothetical protein